MESAQAEPAKAGSSRFNNLKFFPFRNETSHREPTARKSIARDDQT